MNEARHNRIEIHTPVLAGDRRSLIRISEEIFGGRALTEERGDNYE